MRRSRARDAPPEQQPAGAAPASTPAHASEAVGELLRSEPSRRGLPARIANRIANGTLPPLAEVLAMTDAELASVSGIGARTLRDFAAWVEDATARCGCRLDRAQVAAVRAASPPPEPPPRAAPRATGEGSRARLLQRPLHAHVTAWLRALPDRSRDIVRRRVLSAPAATLVALGDAYGITRERARQLEQRALARLDPGGRLRALADGLIDDLRRARDVPLWLPALAEAEPWFAGSEPWLGPLLATWKARHRVGDLHGRQLVAVAAAADVRRLTLEVCRHLDRVFAGRDAAPGGVERCLRAFLAERDATELAPLVRERGQGLVRTRRGFGYRPTAAERIEQVLAREPRPFSRAELRGALPDVRPARLELALASIDVLCVEPGRYLLRAHLRRFDAWLPRVREDIVELMRCEPWRQWRVPGLHAALAEAGAGWTRSVPPHALEHLLLELDEVRALGRGVYGLAAEHGERLQIAELGARILEQRGRPLPLAELRAAILGERDLGPALRPTYPLAELADGRIGLATRDLGIDRETWDAYADAVRRHARRHGAVDDAFLAATLHRLRPVGPPVPAGVLRRLTERTIAAVRGRRSRGRS